FGFGRTPLGRRDMSSHRLQLLAADVSGQGVRVIRLSYHSSDQRSMHQEIRIAADRGGKVSIAAQSQAEMTNVVLAVDGLCLAAKDEVIDEGRLWSSRRAAQHPVEQLRFEGLPFGEGETGNACLREKYPQSLHLLRVRRVMHAIHARLVACLE